MEARRPSLPNHHGRRQMFKSGPEAQGSSDGPELLQILMVWAGQGAQESKAVMVQLLHIQTDRASVPSQPDGVRQSCRGPGQLH